MKVSLSWKIAPWMALVIVISISVGVASFRSVNTSADQNRWVDHTNLVLRGLQTMRTHLAAAQAEARAYAITGEERYLERYTLSSTALEREFRAVLSLVSDNPAQAARLKEIEPGLEQYVAVQSVVIERAKARAQGSDTAASGNMEATAVRQAVGRANDLADSLKTGISDVEVAESALLIRRSTDVYEGSWRLLALSVGGSVTNFFLLGLVLLMVASETARREKSESSLRESEQRFRGAFDSNVSGMALASPDGRWLLVNPSLCETLGYSEAELTSMSVLDVTHPDDVEPSRDAIRRILAGEVQSYRLEKRYRHRDGRTVWAFLSVSLVRDAQGNPLHMVAQVEDVTERRLGDEARRLSESTVRSFYDSTPQMMGVVEPRGDDILFVSANAATATFLGEPTESVSGRTAAAVGLPRKFRREWLKRLGESEAANGPNRFEFAFRDGLQRRHFWATICRIGATQSSASQFSFLVEDYTARKRAKAFHDAQVDAMRVLAEAATVEEAVPRLLEAIGSQLGVDVGESWILDAGSGLLKLDATWCSRPGLTREFVEGSRRLRVRAR